MHRWTAVLSVAFVMTVAGRGPAAAEDPAGPPAANKGEPALPKDGLDEPFTGFPGVPREFLDARGDRRVRSVRPGITRPGHMFTAEFEYDYADPAVAKQRWLTIGTLTIHLSGFTSSGVAHRQLHRWLALESKGGSWDVTVQRLVAAGLWFRKKGPDEVDAVGVVRHVWIVVGIDSPGNKRREGGIETLRKEIDATVGQVAEMVRAAPPAESDEACSVSEVEVRATYHGPHDPWIHFRAQAGVDFERSKGSGAGPVYRPVTLWVNGQVLTNATSFPGRYHSLVTQAERGDESRLPDFRVYCVAEGNVFHVFPVPLTKLPDGPDDDRSVGWRATK